MSDQGDLPATLGPAVHPRVAQAKIDRKIIHDGGYVEREKYWVERFEFFKEHGYLLRPRYRPDWKPTWTSDASSLLWHEDAITSARSDLMDARRLSDGVLVMFKRVPKSSSERKIGEIFVNEENGSHPRNHCIPLLDVLRDASDPENAILVFPLLRGITNPPVASVREAIEFISQTLEGLNFMHERYIAHRDCAIGNIMMEGRLLFPEGWHPIRRDLHYDGGFLHRTGSQEPSRTAVGKTRYYFIDFGISTYGQMAALGLDGQERAPELSDEKPYDPFRLDIYMIGKVYQRYLLDRHKGLEFLEPFVADLTQQHPMLRPTATDALNRFAALKGRMKSGELSRRLHPLVVEAPVRRVYRDVVYHVQDALWRMKPKQRLPPYEPSRPSHSESTSVG